MGEKKAEVPVGKELVRMTGIMKEFPGVKALDNVKLDLYAGEVLALLGENGAGKSTLMKILSGVYQRDDGEIILFGNKIGEWDANKAKNAGVSIIHQELNMCTHLSVAENIFLGRELIKNGRLDNERMNQETKEILHKLNIDIDPREQVSELAVSKQQMVEIAKALSQNAKVLIMDEPTSALTSKEIDELFKIIHQLKSEGIGIIYISHRLEELQHIVDRVIIMRDGKYITQMPYDINRMDEIIANMVGHEIKEKFPRVSCEKGKKILEVKHLNAGRMVRDINLELYEGEIVGIAGLMGAGRTETTRAIFGADPKESGEILVDGKTIKIMSSAQDHKRAKDGDQGLNTGGMGNFSPSPFYTKEVDEFCKKYIYQATVDAMKAEGRPFKGVIFFGLMLTPDGPKVLEYNARFGDPEAQVVLPRLENDIVDVFEACIDGTLDQVDLKFDNDRATVCVILASDGYPVEYKKGFPIEGLEKFKGKDDYYVFHSGTKFNENGQIVTNGGRVLGVTATGKDLKEARKKAYEATEWISFENKYMRHDIGKAIDDIHS